MSTSLIDEREETGRTARRVSDNELVTMHDVWRLLESLEQPARRRVMAWVNSRLAEDEEVSAPYADL